MNSRGWTYPVLALACFLALLSCGQSKPLPALTPEQQMELKTLTEQLLDPARSSRTKLDAAKLLLMRRYAGATEALGGFLSDPSNRPARIAVAEAIAAVGEGRKGFVEPLLKMLTGPEASVRAPAGRALATFKDYGVIEKLVSIATDPKHDRAVRLVTISSMRHLLDKRAVDALVRLLDEKDQTISAAAADALASLTNIGAFRTDKALVKRWWARNKHKDRSEWLADLTDSLARSKASLEEANARLRERLAKAMTDLYNSTGPGQRDAMLLAFLKDPLPDVRLVGTTLAGRRVAAAEVVPDDIRAQVRLLLGDPEPRVRRASALLVANLAGDGATGALLEQLRSEELPDVRQDLLTGLGQLADPAALPAVLAEVGSGYENVAASAAAALARIAEKKALDSPRHAEAVKALLERYERVTDSADGAALRSSLLTAMGVLGDKAFSSVLEGAVKDSAATVRLAAVNGLARLGETRSASVIATLISNPGGDSDRGVRQAAISALGALSPAGHLQEILLRTDPAVETDAAVRRQAWDVTMKALSDADAPTLSGVLNKLDDRPDAADQRIKIMKMHVALLKADQSPKLPTAQRRLGLALLQAGKPSEAAVNLSEAHVLYVGAKSSETPKVWLEWVEALLVADDAASITVMSKQSSEETFAKALQLLNRRLDELKKEKEAGFSAIIVLAGQAAEKLAPRLSDQQHKALSETLTEATEGRRLADEREVASLVVQLVGDDDSARRAAEAALRTMGKRAIRPLLMELQEAVAGSKPNPEAEKAILALLKGLAPGLTGYDASAPVDRKLQVIEEWLNSS